MNKYIITAILVFYLQCGYAVTVTYGSYPQHENDGFYFSDGQGNSIYMGSQRMMPYIYNNYPSAIWVDAATNRLPTNLIVYQYINGYPSYLCRVLLDGKWDYGQLIVNKGCVLQRFDNAFSAFQVLVR